MDKQKQIEEMAKHCCNACEMGWGCDYGDCAEKGKDGYKNCGIAKETAEMIYNAGYRKIHENAVVLTEAESFGDIEDLLTEFDEMGFTPTNLHPYPNAYASNWKLRLAWAIGQLRNATAVEILQKVKSYTLDKEVGMKYLIDKLAKEYGVEIDE